MIEEKAILEKANFWVAASKLQLDRDLEKAKTGFYNALRLNHKSVQAHLNLGQILAQQRKMAAAKEHFQQVIALEPNQTKAYVHLGKILAYENNPKKALYYFQLGQKTDPKAEHIAIYINKMRRHLCDWHDYEAQLQELISIISNFLEKQPAYRLNPFCAFPFSLEQFQRIAQIQATRISQKTAKIKQHLNFQHKKRQS